MEPRRHPRVALHGRAQRALPLRHRSPAPAPARGEGGPRGRARPGRTSPLYLHRATQAGEEWLAGRERRAPRRLPPRRRARVDAETLYLPASAWAALSVLAAAHDPHTWVSSSEIGERIRGTLFFEDGVYLERRGLVERHHPEAGTRRNEPMQYRATALGRGARLRDRRASESRVQVVVPGIVLQPPGPGSWTARDEEAGR